MSNRNIKVRCPICKTVIDWETSKWRPFCSERCKMIDLGAWASEEYYIEGGKPEEEEDEASDAGEGKEDL